MRSQRFKISKLTPRKGRKPVRKRARSPARKPAQSLTQNCVQTPPDEGEGDQIRKEQLAFVAEEAEFDSGGEDCELHVYETRLNTRGEFVCLRAGTKVDFEPYKRRSYRACLLLNRYYTPDGELSRTDLEIQSRHIIKALREVINSYPGIDFTSKSVTIHEPPRCLFHYQAELREYIECSKNERLKSHMQLCLRYMEKTLHKEIKILNSIKIKQFRSLELEHRHLWLLFKPGCLIYCKIDVKVEFLTRLRSISSKDNGKNEIVSWEIRADCNTWDGSQIGLCKVPLDIPHYDGCKPVCDLPTVPLSFLPDEQRIRHHALERGRKFLSLCGTRHCLYHGLAFLCSIRSPDTSKTDEVIVRHRIMLDAKEFKHAVTGHHHKFIHQTRIYEFVTEAISNMSDEEIMICSTLLRGYSLELKRWGFFEVTGVTEIAYNDKAFHALVLAEQKKKLISALLERQDDQQEDEFDDLISGKGKGLIFLLHGPPGVGKTYTAESIADHTRRPLLKVNSGELDDCAEQRLGDLFSLAARWAGILLLDEADVFMQERSVQDLVRNRLVSILLRVLEYNEGILFLTTNRVETIDPAFQSRIHLSIAYPPLSVAARHELWNTFILRANRGQPPEWLAPDFLDQLAEETVNGREIKNIVRTAYALARSTKRDLQPVDLVQGLDALKQFDAEFSNRSGQRKIVEV